jgi:hypothetical protein
MQNSQPLTNSTINDLEFAIDDDNVEELERLVGEGLDVSQQFPFSQIASVPTYTPCIPFRYAWVNKRWTCAEFLLGMHMSNERFHFTNAYAELDALLRRSFNIGQEHEIIIPRELKRIIQKLCSLVSRNQLCLTLLSPNVRYNLALMQLLIDCGADVRLLESRYNLSPLLHATAPESMQLLLQNGANPMFSRHGDGRTPVRVLSEMGLWRMLEVQRCMRVLSAFCEDMELDPRVFPAGAYEAFRIQQNNIEAARGDERLRQLAVMMGDHRRLGNGSWLSGLPPEIFPLIFNNRVHGFQDPEALSAAVFRP